MVSIYPQDPARRDGSGRRRRGANDANGASFDALLLNPVADFFSSCSGYFVIDNCAEGKEKVSVIALDVYFIIQIFFVDLHATCLGGARDELQSTGIRNSHRDMFIRNKMAAYSVAMARPLNLGALSILLEAL